VEEVERPAADLNGLSVAQKDPGAREEPELSELELGVAVVPIHAPEGCAQPGRVQRLPGSGATPPVVDSALVQVEVRHVTSLGSSRRRMLFQQPRDTHRNSDSQDARFRRTLTSEAAETSKLVWRS
jgi:hypothetical protein